MSSELCVQQKHFDCTHNVTEIAIWKQDAAEMSSGSVLTCSFDYPASKTNRKCFPNLPLICAVAIVFQHSAGSLLYSIRDRHVGIVDEYFMP